jgi:alanine dehydrogenase
MLILDNEDIAKLLTMEDTIEALRISNREIAEFRSQEEFTLNRPRTNCYLPWKGDEAETRQIIAAVGGNDTRVLYDFKSMEGGSPHFGVWAVRSSSDLVRFTTGTYGPTYTYLRYGDLPGHKGYSDLIFLYNIHDAQFEAILQSAVLQRMRVAATSALGVDYLCPESIKSLAMFGSGWQAAANMRALCHVRPGINRVQVFSPNEANRDAFAARMRGELGLDVVAMPSPEEAVKGMDLICEATSARSPVFDGELLRPGQHMVSIGGGDERFARRSMDPRAVARCAHIAVHSLEIRFGLEEITDCIEEGKVKWDDLLDLPDLISGRRRVAVAHGQCTFFKNNVGLGSQFASVGGMVLQRAKERNIGFAVPQEKVAQFMRR